MGPFAKMLAALGRRGTSALKNKSLQEIADVQEVAKSVGSWSDAAKPWTKLLPGGKTETITDVARGTTKSAAENKGLIRRVLGSKLTKFGLPAAAGLYLWNAVTGEPETPTAPYDPNKVNPRAGMPADVTAQAQARLDTFLKEQERILREAYAAAPVAVPGAELLDPASAITNEMGGATIAQMQALAQRAAQDAAATKQAGATGALSINDIYGAGAQSMRDIAATSGVGGGLVPVSGEAAVAPAQTAAAGAALADYLQQNQLISAQDQGFLSQLANTLGPAYANQFLMQDRTARAAMAARQQARQQELELERQRNLQQSLAELGLTGAQQRLELDLAALEQEQTPTALLDPKRLAEIAGQYEKLSDEQRQSLAVTNDIYSVEDYINAVLAQGE
jgi:hypothetical protein